MIARPSVASDHMSASAGAMRLRGERSAKGSDTLPVAASKTVFTTMPWIGGSAPVEIVACATPVAEGR